MSRPSSILFTSVRKEACDIADAALRVLAYKGDEDAERDAYTEAYIDFVANKYVDLQSARRYASIDYAARNDSASDLTDELKSKDKTELRACLAIMTSNQIREVVEECGRAHLFSRGPNGLSDPVKVKLSQRIASILAEQAADAAVSSASTRQPRFVRQAQIARLCSVAADLSPHALVVELKRLLADAEADLPSSKKARQE